MRKKRKPLRDRIDEIKKSMKPLNEKKNTADADLEDATSLQKLLTDVERETCGYRVYFTVHCGSEDHKVYLVTADRKAATTASERTIGIDT